jgi:hypothetical protein
MFEEKRFILFTVLESETPKWGSPMIQPVVRVPLSTSHPGESI